MAQTESRGSPVHQGVANLNSSLGVAVQIGQATKVMGVTKCAPIASRGAVARSRPARAGGACPQATDGFRTQPASYDLPYTGLCNVVM